MRNRILRQLGGLGVLALLVGGVVVFSKVTVDPRLEARNENLASELARVEARNHRLQAELADLRASIKLLRDAPSESLHHARTDLGMVRGGEVVYQFAEGGGSN